MLPSVLMIDSDAGFSRRVRQHLLAEGFSVRVARDADEAALAIAEARPDAILLAWKLPGSSGIELCRQFRRRPSTGATPIILVSDQEDDDACVRALATGADDFVAKPCSPAVLSARLRAILRRSNPLLLVEVLRAEGIELNRSTWRVRFGGAEVRLGATEFRLLQFFMSHPERVHSRAYLLDEIWGDAADVGERTVDVHVGRLRKTMRKSGLADPIRTVRGGGYVFSDG